jgi:hypothetical protein
MVIEQHGEVRAQRIVRERGLVVGILELGVVEPSWSPWPRLASTC